MHSSIRPLTNHSRVDEARPSTSQVLSKAYKQVVEQRRIHKAIQIQVQRWEREDENWSLIML